MGGRYGGGILSVLFVTFFLVIGDVSAICAALPVPVRRTRYYGQSGKELAWEMFSLVHQENPRLYWNSCLARVASLRARRIMASGHFGHKDPLTGENPAWGMIRDNCFDFREAGENLVKGSDNPEMLDRALMHSPPHRQNIMDPNFELVGIGCFHEICVQEFASY